MIGNAMHYFPGLTEFQILHGMSYQNLIMYFATVPKFKTSKTNGKEKTTKSEKTVVNKPIEEMGEMEKYFNKINKV